MIWNFLEQLARRGMGIIITIILAKLLTPEDFGLISMMAIFLALGQSLMDSGFTQALIRKKNAKEEDYNTAFYSNIGLGVVSYALLYICAPAISAFYNEPNLEILIRVSSIAILINSFQVVQIADLSRKLDFKTQLKATFPAVLLSGVIAVLLAKEGFGVWALVIQMLMAALFQTLFLWILNKWLPGLSFSFTSLKEMYSFGYKLFLSGALETVFKNIYVVIIAKVFSAHTAGLYFFAERMKELITGQIINSIQKVSYPALSKQQDDLVKLKSDYRKVIRVTVFAYFPSVAILAALAKPLYTLMLPEKWHHAHFYFQLLCIAALLLPLHSINLNILRVLGRSDLLLGLQIFKKALLALTLWIGIRFGILGVLWAQIINSVISYYPNKYYSEKLIDYTLMEQWRDIKLPFSLSLFLGLLVFYIGSNNVIGDAAYVVFSSISFVILYISLSTLMDPKLLATVKYFFNKRKS
ncbi:MAG: lipopolysaccharide biosynthesis protein [Alcanivorax sp.]|nr:lipopolysaccharide biosynthesis protein [Alcanivorax sp.]